MATMGGSTIDVGADGVALITIFNPPVNSLSFDVLYSLKEHFEEALRRKDVKAIVVTGANGKFSGGFDITNFGAIQRGEVKPPETGYVSVTILSETLEASHKPSVAAIDGLALGGGLEIAMVCHARISTPNAQLGLPELQLGVIPGFGGTQRLPRLVGITKALEMMLTSKPIKAKEAQDLGLVDAVVSSQELVSSARKWALDMVSYKKPWVCSLHRTDKLDTLEDAREIFKFARAEARKRAPNLSHPITCIDVVEEGIVSGPLAGLWKEAKEFEGLLRSDVCKSLVHVFFSLRATSKVSGVTDLRLTPRKFKKIAVLGGGLMGSGIATALLLGNYTVILKEINEEQLEAGIGRVKANLQSRVNKGRMTPQKYDATLSLLKGVLNYEHFRDVDIVIEAVIENPSLKQTIFSDLEKHCPPHCILTSNTSTIDLNVIGEKTRSQDRIAGAHFFSPAHVMPLLEIIRTDATSPQVLVDLLELGKKIKKTPVVVKNCTGFAVNRMNVSYIMAAIMLAERGANMYRIDEAITKFGMPMGPFRLCDLVGFGTLVASGMQFVEHMGDNFYKSLLIPIMHEDKTLGEGNKKGFYLYDKGRKGRPDADVEKYVDRARIVSGVAVDPKFERLSEKDIVEMILFPLVNEACRVYSERVAVKPSDVDVLSIMGMGFPPYRGGVLFWADSVGPKYICSKLESWARAYGDFLKPCEFLADKSRKNSSLSFEDETSLSRL